ncbi:MAG: Saccharopine dehydrogenase [Vezdaea aestivalis]|nr:MAG: Saccharopine dehydrogenase [Vezdaea aestivalis]
MVSPNSAKALIQDGFQINVERSSSRTIADGEFDAAEAMLVAEGSWPDAPLDPIIVGLKELANSNEPIHHTHI